MLISIQQSAVSFQLSGISYQLSAISIQPSAFSFQLSAVSLWATHTLLEVLSTIGLWPMAVRVACA
ncbi:hypothetical protein [Moorena sp. SIO3A2]|uniref:hypothetical protein n=1 Tax=Moorena sp. SIO3A2 TaxID=2607841 RepID=UPI00257C2D10|nr:hypothetical protein [Moorena sp. SIO3A2]